MSRFCPYQATKPTGREGSNSHGFKQAREDSMQDKSLCKGENLYIGFLLTSKQSRSRGIYNSQLRPHGLEHMRLCAAMHAASTRSTITIAGPTVSTTTAGRKIATLPSKGACFEPLAKPAKASRFTRYSRHLQRKEGYWSIPENTTRPKHCGL